MSNIEVFGLDVLSAFWTRDITILGKGKFAHIILKDDISWYSVTLGLKKMACPKDITRFIIEPNEFTFGGALWGYFLLDRRTTVFIGA
jgi:hypothetical protein